MLPPVYNAPFAAIFLCMVSAIILSIVRSDKLSLAISMTASLLSTLLCLALTVTLARAPESYVYTMGKFPAPFGNEIKAGPLQALMSTAFCFVMFCAQLGGRRDFLEDVPQGKLGLACVMMNMTLASLLVLTYTNDIFTGYVFIEISTIAACALVMIRQTGETFVATIRYLFMSLFGSGLFLFGIIVLYAITGHLLMPQLSGAVAQLAQTGESRFALLGSLALITAGLGVKSGMYPFHRWLPWAHGSASTGSSAILSGLVLKGYVMLLITVYCRVFTLPVVRQTGLNWIVFAFGLLGMLMGSVYAIREGHSKRMLAYSSVAQLGYVFMGVGLATPAGMAAACFQILAHACSKALLFLSVGRLSAVSGHQKQLRDLRGSAWRAPVAGLGFLIGTLSMIGIPLLAGFSSKLNFALGAQGIPSALVLLMLVVSSVLNALYYIPALICFWSPAERGGERAARAPGFAAAAAALSVAVVALGVFFTPVMALIETGLGLM